MKFKRYFKKENGFTLIELILASSISLSTIMIGFYVLKNIIEGNKIDEIQFGLNSQVNDALDFIIDEVESGERIIDKESNIRSLNNNCSFPSGSTFIFGIKLPNQALTKSDYIKGGNEFNLSQIDCPIVYSLKKSTKQENGPYELLRYGPQFNEKGFYLSPSFNDFQNSTILENISAKENYKKIKCNTSWKSLKTIRGFSYCIDNFNKSIEIQIKVENNKNKIANNPNTSLLSSGGFSRVQDSAQVGLIPSPSLSGENAPICIGGECCWLGVCLKSRKITFLIDISENMDDDFGHRNGEIINGKWSPSNPEFITPRINGQGLITYAISSLKDHLNRLPTSDSDQVFFQIIAFNNITQKYPDSSPIKLSNSTRLAAFKFLDNLETGGISNPWEGLCSSLINESTEQVILVSSSLPTNSEGTCAGKPASSTNDYAEIIEEYNRDSRSLNDQGSLIIDTVSYFHNFCDSNKNYFNNNWMGRVSMGDESQCTHIK